MKQDIVLMHSSKYNILLPQTSNDNEHLQYASANLATSVDEINVND